MFELTPNDFLDRGQRLASKFSSKPTIVKFYLPQCGWCKASQPDYVALDKTAGAYFNVAQMDISKYREWSFDVNNSSVTGYKLKGYPTYAVFVKSTFRTLYNGNRTTSDMLSVLAHLA